MRRLRIGFVVVLVFAVAGDFLARAYAESRFESNVQAGLGLREKPELELGGFPFLLAMSRGRLSSAGFSADGVVNEGLRVEHVELDLRTVTFSTTAVLAGESGTNIRARSGDGQATVTAADLSAFLAERGYPGRILFGVGEATVEATFGGFGAVSATGPLRVDASGRLVFEPNRAQAGNVSFPAGQAAFSFELPRPFEGFHYTGVDLTQGRATFRIAIRDAVIPIEKGNGG
jgi:hypothetical protein